MGIDSGYSRQVKFFALDAWPQCNVSTCSALNSCYVVTCKDPVEVIAVPCLVELIAVTSLYLLQSAK